MKICGRIATNRRLSLVADYLDMLMLFLEGVAVTSPKSTITAIVLCYMKIKSPGPINILPLI